jgi:response regulator RpfG family c-di-GMP phosphodiesterase
MASRGMEIEPVPDGIGAQNMSQTILILDDEPDNVLLIEETIKRNLTGVRTVAFTSPQEAVAWCDANEPDLCLIDYKMPGMNGIEFMARVRDRMRFQGVPMIMITGQPGNELQQQALDSGATDFLSKPINVADVVVRTRNHLRLRESLRDGRQDMGKLECEMKESAQRLIEQEQATIIQRLTHLSGYRDEETGSHMRRMAHISQLISRELGLDNRFCDMLLLAAPMHDIGKVGIPDCILLKPGKLDPAERGVMQTHARIGHDLLKDSHSELLRMGAEIALTHHEKYSGEGYPDGLAGEAIPLSGRIVATADVFDALINARHYKKAWALGDAIEFMRTERGRHFDPGCVAALLRRIDEVMDIQKQFAENDIHSADNQAGLEAHLPSAVNA